MEQVTILWNEYGQPILTAILYVASGSALIGMYGKKLVNRILNGGKAKEISSIIVGDCEKALSKTNVKLSLEPLVNKEIEKLSTNVNEKVDRIAPSLLAITEDIKAIKKALSYSRIIPQDVKKELTEGKAVEVEELDEISICDLKIVDTPEETKEVVQDNSNLYD